MDCAVYDGVNLLYWRCLIAFYVHLVCSNAHTSLQAIQCVTLQFSANTTAAVCRHSFVHCSVRNLSFTDLSSIPMSS